MEPIEKTDFRKRHTAAGPHGLPQALVKNDDDVLATELTKLMESICGKEQASALNR